MIDGLTDSRILIVEDESLVAMLLETILEDMGCQPLGPVATVDEALAFLESGEALDAALLDVNVAGREVFPVAAMLEARGVPFVFSTGYGEGGLPEAWRGRPTIQKPFTEAAVRDALLQTLGVAKV
jgi:CheY-like chemotaxis protein